MVGELAGVIRMFPDIRGWVGVSEISHRGSRSTSLLIWIWNNLQKGQRQTLSPSRTHQRTHQPARQPANLPSRPACLPTRQPRCWLCSVPGGPAGAHALKERGGVLAYLHVCMRRGVCMCVPFPKRASCFFGFPLKQKEVPQAITSPCTHFITYLVRSHIRSDLHAHAAMAC